MTWILILREGMLLMSSSSVEEVDFFLVGDPFILPECCCWPPIGLPGWPMPAEPPLAGDPGDGWLTWQ